MSSSLSPSLLEAVGAALIGTGGLAGVVTALATRRNYVVGGFRSLNDATASALAAERAARLEAEAEVDRLELEATRWRDAYYSVRWEAATGGLALTTPPPIEGRGRPVPPAPSPPLAVPIPAPAGDDA